MATRITDSVSTTYPAPQPLAAWCSLTSVWATAWPMRSRCRPTGRLWSPGRAYARWLMHRVGRMMDINVFVLNLKWFILLSPAVVGSFLYKSGGAIDGLVIYMFPYLWRRGLQWLLLYVYGT